MRKETDLDGVKNVLRDFLHLPIEKTKFSPIVVQHPIFESGYTVVDENLVNLMEPDGLKQAVLATEKQIDKINKLIQCTFLVRKSYYLTFLKFIKQYLSLEDFSYLLGLLWTQEEVPNNDVNVPISLSVKWFREADKKFLMDAEEYSEFQKLPEMITVYRGVSKKQKEDGMSWTTSKKKAEWFSKRYGNGYVIMGNANKKDVLAYFTRRNEKEIVIEPQNVKNTRRID